MRSDLRQLGIYDLLLVLMYVCRVIACRRLGSIRPVSIVPIISALQLVLLAHLSWRLDLWFYFAGNVAVIALALLPSALRATFHPPPSAITGLDE